MNPNDGTLVPYSAVSMFDKDVYKNTISLISEKRPDMLEKAELSKEDIAFLGGLKNDNN